jgi:hypothetical protein
LAFPAWVAVKTHEPDDTRVKVEDATEHTAVSPDVTVGVSPEDAETESATVDVEYV